MKLPAFPSPGLTRRHWLVLAASGLSGCGGGGTGPGTDTGALPGTGGTGIYVAGSISGFGSVILGGIKFDDTAASVTVDGAIATPAALRLGMVAEVLGERSKSLPAQGVASSIDVWSIARGLVTDRSSGGLVIVAGMNVRIDANTVLDGINDQTSLTEDVPVMVWGLQAAGGIWTATRVAKVADTTTLVTTGWVTQDDDHLYINDIRLSDASSASPAVGTWVRVQGQFNGQERLVVSSFKVLQGPAVTPGANSVIEVEGYITSALVGDRFAMGQWLVDVTAISHPATILVGDKVEVSGTYSDGVLHATQLEVEDESVVQEVDIEAVIDIYNGISDFTLRGQRCNASTAQIGPGVASRLRVGVKVKIHGHKSGEFVRVEELEISS